MYSTLFRQDVITLQNCATLQLGGVNFHHQC
jgi:hypothetical protein